jgi:transcriptional regulator with XRE-family HTH domain
MKKSRAMRAPAASAAIRGTISARVAGLRRAAGLTQALLSQAAGLSPSAVGLIEQGRSTPALGTLESIASALGVTVADLVTNGRAKKSGKN